MNESARVYDLDKKRQETDFGALAQKAAEEHLNGCWEAYWAEEMLEDPNAELPESPAFAPFDGCETCVVREILSAAWPFVERSVREDLEQEERATMDPSVVALQPEE